MVQLRLCCSSVQFLLSLWRDCADIPQNFCWDSAVTPLRFCWDFVEILLRFRWNSTEIPLRFHWDSAKILLRFRCDSAEILLIFCWYSTEILLKPLRDSAVIPLRLCWDSVETLLRFRWDFEYFDTNTQRLLTFFVTLQSVPWEYWWIYVILNRINICTRWIQNSNLLCFLPNLYWRNENLCNRITTTSCTANVLSAEFTDECLRTKSKDN